MLEEDAQLHETSKRPKPEFDFEPRDHIDLAGSMIDVERGARTSGSRFAYLLGDVVRLHQATVQYALDKLVAKGFTPVMTPVLVREEALVGSGFFPEAREQVYAVANADPELFLIGTSEVALAALHMGEILPEADLPLRYCGISSCFRREAGAAGKDTRGIFRTHQFDKVEMFSFCHPDRSWEEHELLLSIEREIADDLGLHYRVMNIAVGDLGAPAAKKYDIEAWLPGQGRYRELTSCSNTTDFQARRLDARYRNEKGVHHLHTLNGTAITSSRTLIAVLETHQRSDGSVSIPEILQELRRSGRDPRYLNPGLALVAQLRSRAHRVAHGVGAERPLPHRHQGQQAHEAAAQVRILVETPVDDRQPEQGEVVQRHAAGDALLDALLLHRPDARRSERDARLLAAQLRERVAVVIVQGGVARVEDEPDAACERIGAEDGVLAAVALVEAQVERARHEHAVGRDELDVARATALQERRLDLQMRHPRPGRVRREAPGTADDGAGKLARGAAQAGAEARQRHGIGVEEDDDVATGGVPAAVARASGVADTRPLHHARAVRAGDRGRAVRRAIVDDDHLVGALGVGEERPEHRAERPLGVERRDHHAHALGPVGAHRHPSYACTGSAPPRRPGTTRPGR